MKHEEDDSLDRISEEAIPGGEAKEHINQVKQRQLKDRARSAESRSRKLYLIIILILLLSVPSIYFFAREAGRREGEAHAAAGAIKAGDDVSTKILDECRKNTELSLKLKAAGLCEQAGAAKQQINETNVKGVPGAPGKNGIDGQDGRDGRDGRNGIDGKNGINGKDGGPGLPGAPGQNGKNGIDGNNGVDGKPGDNGINGSDGKDGQPGSDGKNGEPGTNGINGVDGKDGLPGADGKNGVSVVAITCTQKAPFDWQVSYSDSTVQTVAGPCKGTQGDAGAIGSTGPSGAPGVDGKNAYPFSFQFTVPAGGNQTQTITCVVADPSTPATCS